MEIVAEHCLTTRDFGPLRREIGIVQLLDVLRDSEDRLATWDNFPPQEERAAEDLLGERPVEQRLECLPVVDELGIQAADSLGVRRIELE